MNFRSSLRVTAALFAALSLAAVAHADAAADAKKAIQAAYDKADAALVKKDLKGMFSVYSPDYEAQANGKKMTLAEVQQMAQMQISMIQKPKNKVTIQKFTLKGKEATATTKQDMEASFSNPQTKKRPKSRSLRRAKTCGSRARRVG